MSKDKIVITSKIVGTKYRRYAKKYPRTETIKFRISKEHLDLLERIRAVLNKSQADVFIQALERLGLNGLYQGSFTIREKV